MIGYLPRSGLTAVSREKKIPREPNNKPFVDQAFSVKMAGYWSRFFYEFTGRDGVEVHKHAKKKEFGQYPAILTEKAWSITHIFAVFLSTLAPLFVGTAGKSIRSDAHTTSIS